MGWDVTVAVLCAAAAHAGWNALIKRGRDPLLETTVIATRLLKEPVGPTRWLGACAIMVGVIALRYA